ncbi:hypothetical protein D0Z07_5497, partial [Hyphodiscus hymeniophilus]
GNFMALSPRSTSAVEPFSFAPSQAFEGNDGAWSTFVIRVGTPAQVFRVFISTTSEERWVPVPEGCLSTDPINCGALRGVLPFEGQESSGFQINASSTWIPVNLYELGLDADLNYTGNGEYGFDTVGLQITDSGGVTLNDSIVAGIATKDFYLGEFGLGPKPTNFTTFDNPQQSFMWSLRNQSLIPSLSWGYTAGASYRFKGVPGSLTLGGYDKTRFTANNMTFSFSSDDSKPLTVGLQAIEATNTFDGTVSLLPPDGILSFIDSTVPEIWLPESASTGGETISINLPYAAFDLQATYPIFPNATNYFPLRRAANQSQYTLGRTFLQEAYVIADYNRSTFSVSQSLFNENSTEKIIPIYPPFAKTTHSGMPKNTLMAITIAVLAGAMLLTAGLITLCLVKKRRRLRLRTSNATTATTIVDKDAPEVVFRQSGGYGGNVTNVMEMSAREPYPEMTADERNLRHELPGKDRIIELPAEFFDRR